MKDLADKFKHTPGPWALIDPIMPDGKHYGAGSVVAVVAKGSGPKDYSIAAISAHSPNAPANALLILAAPDMLAALKAVEEWWLSEGKDHFTGAPYAIFATRAAIAKATGATPKPPSNK